MVASTGVSATAYEPIGAVVALIGSLKVKVITAPADEAETRIGFTVSIGIMAVEAAEAADVLSTLTATAVNVYAVPFVKPGTTQDPLAAEIVHVAPPGFAVTTMLFGVIPVPAATETVTNVSPAKAVGVGGVFGTPQTGFTLFTYGPPDIPTTISSSV
jgi:hypothetical protein